MAVGIFEYVDPKGKKPTAYTKIMKKYKVSEEEVVAEAAKFNVTIDGGHFEVSAESKRGRPKTAVEKVSKGVKGRPKKSKKVVELCDDATDDLFADLVASANKDSDSESDVEQVQKVLAKAEAKEAEKLAKAEAKEAEKLAKEAEKLAKEQEKLAKEQEKLAKEQEKKAKAEAKEAEKLAKAAEKKAKADAKVATKEAKVATKEEKTADEEPDKVKRFEFEGVKYLKSKNTGIIYNMEQDVVGKWNEQSNKIDFKEAEDEEEEEEYEDE
jgi:uncharacterized membrane protein YqiK